MVPQSDRKLALVVGILCTMAGVLCTVAAVFTFLDPRPAYSEVRGMVFIACCAGVIVMLPNAFGWLLVAQGKAIGYRILAVSSVILVGLSMVGISFKVSFPACGMFTFVGLAFLFERRYRQLRQEV